MKQKKTPWQIRVMAEYGSSGLWGFSETPVGIFRHGMLEHRHLKLPRELSDRFDRWILSYEDQSLCEQPDTQGLNDEGLALAMLVKRHLGPGRHVEFQGEDAEGRLLPAVVIACE